MSQPTEYEYLPIRVDKLICPEPGPLQVTPAMKAHIDASIRGHMAKLDAALELTRELEAENGPVTDAELEALRAVWPPEPF